MAKSKLMSWLSGLVGKMTGKGRSKASTAPVIMAASSGRQAGVKFANIAATARASGNGNARLGIDPSRLTSAKAGGGGGGRRG